MALQVREKERVCIRVLPSLVAHTIGYGMTIGAHNIVYVQTHLAGSTMFAWYALMAPSYRCAENGRV